MTPTPTYAELRARGAREFLTDGPNSGGVAGLLWLDGWVWWFRADWTPEVDASPTPIAAFLRRYGESEARGYRALCDALRQAGYTAGPTGPDGGT